MRYAHRFMFEVAGISDGSPLEAAMDKTSLKSEPVGR